MHVPRHAAIPRRSRLKFAAWVFFIALGPALAVLHLLADHDPAPADLMLLSGVSLVAASAVAARWLRSRKFRQIQSFPACQCDLLSARLRRHEAEGEISAARLDQMETAWQLAFPPPPGRPDLTVIPGGG